MSYASPIKTRPETLHPSMGWAILASLGIHGLLWKVMPLLPINQFFKPAEAQQQRTVGLVDLTPSEQSGLPQVSTAPDTLPPLTNLPQVSTAPGTLPPSVNLPPVLPPLPPDPYSRLIQPPSVNLPSVLPPLPPAPSGNNQLITPVIPIPEQPPGVWSGLPPAPPGNNQSTTPLIPILRTPPSELNTNQPKHQETSRANSKTKLSAASALPASTAKHWTREKLLAVLRGEQPQRNSFSSTSTTRTASVPASTAKQWTREKLLAVLRGEQPQRNSFGSISTTRTASVPASTAKHWTREKLLAVLRGEQPQRNSFSSISTATAQKIAQVNAFKEWYQKVHHAYPRLETKATIRQKIKTCEKQLDGAVALFGVVVNSQGKIISGPDFMPKNGAANIQQAAKDYLSRYRFRKTVKATEQPFRLEFEYGSGNCSKPTPKPSPENTHTKKSQS